jgi:hypothetical protein
MKHLLFVAILFLTSFYVTAQTEIIEKLKNRYDLKNGYQTRVNLSVNVTGLTIPDKELFVKHEKGKKPQIKGKGILLIPKKGFLNQFSDLLTIAAHWILLSENQGFITYKLVSLDPKSDWITADVKIFKTQNRIDEINLTTKESGEYHLKHTYTNQKFPSSTEILFWTNKLNIPLKFLGKTNLKSVKDKDGKVKGQIVLKFYDFQSL